MDDLAELPLVSLVTFLPLVGALDHRVPAAAGRGLVR